MPIYEPNEIKFDEDVEPNKLKGNIYDPDKVKFDSPEDISQPTLTTPTIADTTRSAHPLRPDITPSDERPEERGLLGTIGTGLARGVVGLPSDIGAGIETIGQLVGSETLKRAGGGLKTATEVPASIQEAKELDEMDWYKPKKLASIIAEALPLTIGSMGSGLLARLGLKGLGVAGKAARVGGYVAGGTPFGLVSAGQMSKEAREAGLGERESALIGTTAGVAEAMLEFAGISKVFKIMGIDDQARRLVTHKLLSKEGFKQILKDAGGLAAIEGGEELSQTVKDNILRNIWDKEQTLFEGGLQSFVIGALMGGGMGAGASAISPRGKVAPEVEPTPTDITGKPVTDYTVNAPYIEPVGAKRSYAVDDITGITPMGAVEVPPVKATPDITMPVEQPTPTMEVPPEAPQLRTEGIERYPVTEGVEMGKPEAIAGEVAEPVSPVKEPWQMTKEEIIKINPEDIFIKGLADQINKSKDKGKSIGNIHKQSVEKALSEGKQVPPEVLKDYPDLAKVEPVKLTPSEESLMSGAIEKKLINLGNQGFEIEGSKGIFVDEAIKKFGYSKEDAQNIVDRISQQSNVLEVFKKPTSKPEPTQPSGDIFIRVTKKAEERNPTRSLSVIPNKEGYDKVYKPYGAEGKGFYYVKKAEVAKPEPSKLIPNKLDKLKTKLGIFVDEQGQVDYANKSLEVSGLSKRVTDLSELADSEINIINRHANRDIKQGRFKKGVEGFKGKPKPEINPYNEEIARFMKTAKEKLGINYNEPEVIKTASKIAQLDNSKEVQTHHVAEAIQYRGNAEDYLKYFKQDETENKSNRKIEDIKKNYSDILDRVEQVLGNNVKKRAYKILDDIYKEKIAPEPTLTHDKDKLEVSALNGDIISKDILKSVFTEEELSKLYDEVPFKHDQTRQNISDALLGISTEKAGFGKDTDKYIESTKTKTLTHDNEPVTKTETKEILKDAGDEKAQTTLKEQKSYLISEIDKAIGDAQVLKENDIEGGLVTIEIPGDGTFNIINTVDALTKFKEIARKNFPEKEEYRTKTPMASIPAKGTKEGKALIEEAKQETIRQERFEDKVKHWMDADNSRPVSEAIVKIDEAGLLEKVEGHSKAGGLLPFSVRIKDPVTGKTRYLTNATSIKKFANDLEQSVEATTQLEAEAMEKQGEIEEEKGKYQTGGEGVITGLEGVFNEKELQEAGSDTEAMRTLKDAMEKDTGKELPDNAYVEFNVHPDWKGKVSSASGFITKLAKNFNKDIVFFKSTDPAFHINGAVLEDNPSAIYININSHNPHLSVLGHELFHQMKENHPDLYGKFLSAIEGEIKNFQAYKGLKNTERIQMGFKGVSSGLAKEELLADFTGNQFLNKDFWNKLAEKEPTVFKRVIQYAKDLIDKTIAILKTDRSLMYSGYFRDIKKAQDTLADVIAEYAKREQGTGEEALSIKKFTDMTLDEKWETIKDIPYDEMTDEQRKLMNDIMQDESLSVKKQVSEKNLAIVHNLTIANLNHVLKMGGLAVPSTAVIDIKKSEPIGFGEITLIASKEKLGPSATNKYFDADIYSPRYPEVTRFLTDKSKKALNDFLDPLWKEIPTAKDNQGGITSGYVLMERIKERGIEEAFNEGDPLLYYAFLKERGELPNGIDKSWEGKSLLRTTVENQTGKDQYESWALAKIKELGIEVNEKIFNGFTYQGNRRYLPHNLDTVVRLLKKELKDGEGFNYGVPSIRAKSATRFRTVRQMQEARDRIVSTEDMKKVKDEADNEFTDLAENAIPYLKYKRDIGNYDSFSEHIKEAIDTHNFRKVFGEGSEYYNEGLDYKPIVDFVNKLRNLPTEYFEGKIQRLVGLDEFSSAVVPDNTPQHLIDQLKQKGLDVVTYTKGDSADRKLKIQEAVNAKDLSFEVGKQSTTKLTQDQMSEIFREINRIAAPNTFINMSDKLEMTPSREKALSKHGLTSLSGHIAIRGSHYVDVNGDYFRSVINLSLDYADMTDAHHEAFHSVQELLLNDKEKKILAFENPAKGGVATAEIQAKRFAEFAKGERAGLKPRTARIFAKIADFFRRIKHLLNGMGFDTTESIFGKAYEGKYAQREAQARADYGKEALSIKNAESEAHDKAKADKESTYALLDNILESKGLRLNPKIKNFMKQDLSWFNKFINTPKFLGDKFPKFMAVFKGGQLISQRRDEYIADLLIKIQDYMGLPKESQAKVDKIGEYYTLRNELPKNEDLIKAGLNNTEIRALWSLKDTYDDGFKRIVDLYVDMGGDKAEMQKELGKIKFYIPLSRFGEWAVTWKTQATETIPSEMSFETFESEREAKAYANKRSAEGHDVNFDKLSNMARGSTLEGLDMYTLSALAKFAKISPHVADPFLAEAREFLKARGFKKHFIERTGTPGYSKDWVRVHSDYIVSLSNYLARVEGLKAMRQGMEGIDPKKTPELYKYAQKYINYLENPKEEAAKLRGALFLYYLGGNVKSATLNLTQTVTTSWPWLSQYSKKPTLHLARAGKDVLRGIKFKDNMPYFDTSHLEPELADALADSVDVTNEQMIYEYMAVSRGELLTKERGRIARALAYLFGTAETWNRRVTFIAAYRIGKELEAKGGLPEGFTSTTEFAKRVTDRTQFIYGKFNRPAIARGPVGATFFTFKTFTLQYLEMLNRLSKQDKKAFYKALSIMFVLAGAAGLPFMDDLKKLYEKLTGDNLDAKARDLANEVFGDPKFGEVMMRGITRLGPVDMSGAIGLGDVVPDINTTSILGPAGGVLQRLYHATPYVARHQYGRAAETIAPEAIRGPAAAYRIAKEGQRDISGQLISTGEGRWGKGVNVAAKALSFQPSDIARANERERAQSMIGGRRGEKKKAFVSRLARAVFEGEKKEIISIRKEIADYNKGKSRDEWIIITAGNIRESINRLRLPENLARMKRTPKQGRGEFMRLKELFE